MGFDRGTITIDKYLTGIAREYGNRDFSWMKLFPPRIVPQESGYIKVTNKAGYFKGAPARSAGAPAEVSNASYGRISYHTFERANKELILDTDVSKAEPIFNLRRDATWRTTHRVNLSMEIRAMEVATGGGISTSTPDHQVTPSNTWDNKTSSTPLEDISTGKRMIVDAIGVQPNIIFMSNEVAEKLSVHPQIIDRLKYTAGEELLKNGELPPTILGLNVVVANAVYNSAEQGETVSFANIWRRHCIIAHVNPVSSVNFGHMLIWNAINMQTRRWRDEEVRGEYVEVACNFEPMIVTDDAAYWFENVIA